jgi:uncharacterized protein (DUF342 family)
MGSQANLLSSKVVAGTSVEALNIGSRNSSVANIIEVGVNPYIVGRSSDIDYEITQLNKNIDNMKRVIPQLEQLKAANRLSSDKQAELAKLKTTLEDSNQKILSLKAEKDSAAEEMQSVVRGSVKATGTIYSGTQISIGTEKKVLTSDYMSTQFIKTAEGIRTTAAV